MVYYIPQPSHSRRASFGTLASFGSLLGAVLRRKNNAQLFLLSKHLTIGAYYFVIFSRNFLLGMVIINLYCCAGGLSTLPRFVGCLYILAHRPPFFKGFWKKDEENL